MSPIRVLIADDHSLVRTAISEFLRLHSDVQVVGEAVDGEDAVALSRQLDPDVVVMDVSMPRLNGVEATQQITACCPRIKVVGLSMHQSDSMASTMVRAGAVAYVSKDAPATDLLTTIRTTRSAACNCDTATATLDADPQTIASQLDEDQQHAFLQLVAPSEQAGHETIPEETLFTLQELGLIALHEHDFGITPLGEDVLRLIEE